MPSWMKVTGWLIGAVVGVLLLASLVTGSSLLFYRVWAPQWASAEREVFEETKSYRHGQIRDLANMQSEYRSADTDAARQAIRATVRHRFSELSTDDVPEYLRGFLTEMREGT